MASSTWQISDSFFEHADIVNKTAEQRRKLNILLIMVYLLISVFDYKGLDYNLGTFKIVATVTFYSVAARRH